MKMPVFKTCILFDILFYSFFSNNRNQRWSSEEAFIVKVPPGSRAPPAPRLTPVLAALGSSVAAGKSGISGKGESEKTGTKPAEIPTKPRPAHRGASRRTPLLRPPAGGCAASPTKICPDPHGG